MFEITFFEEQFAWAAHPARTKVTLEDLTEGDAVFVSGKLMDPEFVRSVTGRYIPFTAAVARDYCRGERGRGKNKTLLLQPEPGGMVLGVLLVKLSQGDRDALDEFEQVPAVRERVSIRVTVGAHERTATTFVPKE